jgi:hypothetical protein
MTEMIYETIVISTDVMGNPYVAPFGIRERDGMVLIAPFRPSTTLDNLLKQKTATLNLTDDVRVFAGALTGRRDWSMQPADKINGYRLESALGHRELVLEKVNEDEQRPELFFKVVHEVNHQPFRGFNRAQAAVIELSVLVSRLNRLPIEKIKAEMAYLEIAINKTAGEQELEAWTWLLERIHNFQAEILGENQA